jgi:hypothetical protein
MNIDRDEIGRKIEHQRKILRAVRSRLEQRELQEAQQGFGTPPEIVTEINDLTERIQRHEAEIARLQTEAAVDREPLSEVEYRALLAEAWGTPQGRPTVASVARLEQARLRLGIALPRAQELEHQIRVALAEEAVANIDARYLPGLRPERQSVRYREEEMENRRYRETTVRLIECAIRLDFDTALNSFIERLHSAVTMYPHVLVGEVRSMLIAAKAWGSYDEREKIDQFIEATESILEARQKAVTVKDPEPPSQH